MHDYGEDFYSYMSSFALRSARKIVPIVQDATGARTVADFGCGIGAWLCAWQEAGADILGLDGPYVDQSKLLIPRERFAAVDLSSRTSLNRKFDLVQSLEVAEHLAESRAEDFVSDLVQHADHVLFSGAVPGQGGEHHINEQPLQYWRQIFQKHGFAAVDLIRPAVADDADVQVWYRCNTILYVNRSAVSSLSQHAQAHVVPETVPLAEFWPLSSRMRQAVIRKLPRPAVDWLVSLNAKRYRQTRKPAAQPAGER